ncbi:hypothetical protein [Pseudomonas sp. RIT-PI-AD]|uniref:COG3650 family protein n=1 Tax=Pseudomonas sp. RIT-PI-AD TaxID=3035294 RepID=UPI0021D97B93|nr:hypothetical protein [Pseudomonas sp. RIT-PI-AD]
MRARLPLLAVFLPVLGGCQLFGTAPEAPTQGHTVRLQGLLVQEAGQLTFTPCQEQRRFSVQDGSETQLRQDVAALGNVDAPLFADLRGTLGSSKAEGLDGQFALTQVYRVQARKAGCEDPNFQRLLLRANGTDPEWSVNVGAKGLVLQRPDQPPLALPYMEEQLPDGRFNLTSEANGERLELWIAPQRCSDDRGSIQHLSAELRLNGGKLKGCAAYGGGREN